MTKISYFFFALSLFTFASACTEKKIPPTVEPPPVEECQVDISFDADSAVALTLGEEVSGTLCPARDKDWYSFSVADPGSIVLVHLFMETHLSPVQPSYTILKANGDPTGFMGVDPDRSAGEPVDFEGAHRIEEAGEYLITVADAEGLDDRTDLANAFHLSVDVVPDPDTQEPNNTMETATAATPGTPSTGLISTTGDEDWFSLSVEQDAKIIEATLTAPLDIGVELVLDVLAPDGETIVDSRKVAEVDTNLTAFVRAAAAGQAGTLYFLRVRDESGTLAQRDVTLGTYSIDIQILDDPDPLEVGGGNNTPETATPATSGVAHTGAAIGTIGDQDYYRIAPGNVPGVLRIDVTVSGGVGTEIQPQILVLAHDPNREDGDLEDCPCGDDEYPQICLPNGAEEKCGRVWLQRFFTEGNTFSAAFPIRADRPLFVTVNDLGDDGYQDGTNYSITLTTIAEPDPGEGTGDDYLIPNLQVPTYDNSDELAAQLSRGKELARDITAGGLVDSCPIPDRAPVDENDCVIDSGDAGGACLEVCGVPAPPDNSPQVPWTVKCNGESWTVAASGRLSFNGDRDFFRFDVPEAGYWGMEMNYNISAVTPIELTYFVHSEEELLGSFLEASNGVAEGDCTTTFDCNEGSVCVDGRCWADVDNNPAVSNSFPPDGECLFVHVNRTRPIYLEVTDNGINDFDTNMTYSFSIDIKCGCPTACADPAGFDPCQGVPPPP